VGRSDGTLPRAYERVAVEASACSKGYSITLDGKTLRTPGRNALTLPNEALAYAVAAEWQWQETRTVQPMTMPMMTLAATAIDVMPHQRAQVVGKLLEYFSGDPIVCRAPEQAHSKDLPAVQAAALDPMVRWLEAEMGGLKLNVTDSIFGTEQDEAVLWALRDQLDAMDAWELTALNSLSAAGRSLSLALAVARGRLTAAEAVPLMRLDEEYQIQEWGLVEGGHDIDIADTKVRVGAAAVFLKLLRHERAEM
jgi:ATP synthase F1 complex assembly factor 2